MVFWREFFKKIKRENGAKNAIIFPGQSTQRVGMAIKVSPEIMQGLYAQMEGVLGADITLRIQKLVSTDPAVVTPEEKKKMESELLQTQNAQLAVFLVSLAKFQEYASSDEFKTPTFMLGHSLGECTALVASGAMSVEDGFRLVFYRGGQMNLAATLRKGGMVAVRGDIINKTIGLCLRKGADVEIANYNTPHEIVVSGGVESTERVAEALREVKDFSMVKRLAVAGAFHHPIYMQSVEGALERFFEEFQVKIREPVFNVVFNYTGRDESDPKRIKTYIIKQPTNTVRWRQSIEFLNEKGIRRAEDIKEIGSRIFTRQLADFPDFEENKRIESIG